MKNAPNIKLENVAPKIFLNLLFFFILSNLLLLVKSKPL